MGTLEQLYDCSDSDWEKGNCDTQNHIIKAVSTQTKKRKTNINAIPTQYELANSNLEIQIDAEKHRELNQLEDKFIQDKMKIIEGTKN